MGYKKNCLRRILTHSYRFLSLNICFKFKCIIKISNISLVVTKKLIAHKNVDGIQILRKLITSTPNLLAHTKLWAQSKIQ